jgi:hypothetical protein
MILPPRRRGRYRATKASPQAELNFGSKEINELHFQRCPVPYVAIEPKAAWRKNQATRKKMTRCRPSSVQIQNANPGPTNKFTAWTFSW